eukprot:2227938-Pleurochrysis_carterae.AAC.3
MPASTSACEYECVRVRVRASTSACASASVCACVCDAIWDHRLTRSDRRRNEHARHIRQRPARALRKPDSSQEPQLKAARK